MVKGMAISRMISRYSVFMALRASKQKLRTAAKVGKVSRIAGIAAGAVIGWFIAGFIGLIIGGVAGAIIVDSYKWQ